MQPVGHDATLIDMAPNKINFARLGGMVKFCKLLTELETTDWQEIEDFLATVAPRHFTSLPEGKLKIGLSAYGLNLSPDRLHATALRLKKIGKHSNRSIRVIPNKNLQLNAASVLNNKLTHKLGWELVFVKNKNKTIVAQSIAVQDIDKYAARDRQRPYRDARVGMLPPKLAQIIINLAKPNGDDVVLDPFCGTGVLLQEAALMGHDVYGTDIDARMVDYAEKNLAWLVSEYGTSGFTKFIEKADATSDEWQKKYDVIASETYLGRAFSSQPDENTLNKVIHDCDVIHKKFLLNAARQTKPKFRLCLAVPAWKSKSGFRHLPTLDKLEQLGYNRVKFEHAKNNDLIYYRPGQTTARELVVLERK